MKVTTLRLPENLYGDLEAEAADRDLSVSEYVRMLLRDREHTPTYSGAEEGASGAPARVDDLAAEVEAIGARLDAELGELGDRLADVEERVDEIDTAGGSSSTGEPAESSGSPGIGGRGTGTSAREPRGSDAENRPAEPAPVPEGEAAVRWLRERGEPASRKDILAAVFPDAAPIKPDSFWRRHARPALEEAGATYRRNVGWFFASSDGVEEGSSDDGGVYDPTAEC